MCPQNYPIRESMLETPDVRNVLRFHENAKKWINSNVISDDYRHSFMEEDARHPYSDFPTSYPDQINSTGKDLEYSGETETSRDMEYGGTVSEYAGETVSEYGETVPEYGCEVTACKKTNISVFM